MDIFVLLFLFLAFLGAMAIFSPGALGCIFAQISKDLFSKPKN